MKHWTPDFDITTVPDDILMSEAARRSRTRARTRPEVMRQCEHCLQPFGARALRKHASHCPKRKKNVTPPRGDWILRKVTDPEEEDLRAYRYWQTLSPGERIAATWDLTQAAASIRKVN